MPDLPTRAEFFRIGADEVLARSEARPPDQRVSSAEIYTEGSDINLVIAASSAMADELMRQLALRLGALLLSGAKGEDLDRLVADRFSPTIVRKQASPAIATVQFYRVSGALPAVTIPRGTRVQTRTGVVFATTAVGTLAAGSTGPVSVPVQATEAGTDGNVDAGTIVQVIDTLTDGLVQVRNDEPAAGGDVTESDARLRDRARDFFRQARRGTIAAITFGAQTVPGVRQATAIELTDGDGVPNGRVSLYISDLNGQANSALVTQVRNALLEYRGAGIIVDVFGAMPVYQSIRYRLRFQTGVDSTLAFDSVRSLTVSTVNTLPPVTALEVSLLMQIARSVAGVIVLEDAVQEPVGDVIPTVGQVIRTTVDLVTAE